MFDHIDIIVPPDIEPVTFQEGVKQANGIREGDDELFEGMLVASRQAAERYTRRSLINQTLDVWYSQPDGIGYFELPRGRVAEIVGVYVYDGTSPSSIAVDMAGVSLSGTDLVLSDWLPYYRDRRGIRIRIVSGYGDQREDVPAAIRQGILEYAVWMYEHRQGESDAKYAVQAQGGIPGGVVSKWRQYQIKLA